MTVIWTPDDYLRIECEEDARDDAQTVTCPYCGQTGNAAWFEIHDHVNPFGEEER